MVRRCSPSPLLPLRPRGSRSASTRAGRRPGARTRRLYLWSGQHVRRLFPGFENLVADIYWLRTVQYFGGQRAFAQDKQFELLEPLIDITITLDPRLEIAYRYGATFLASRRRGGGPAAIGRRAPGAGRGGQPETGGCARTSASSTSSSWRRPADAARGPAGGRRAARARPSGWRTWPPMSSRGGDRGPRAHVAADLRAVRRPHEGERAHAPAGAGRARRGRRAQRWSTQWSARTGRRPASLDELRAAGLVRRAARRRERRAFRL